MEDLLANQEQLVGAMEQLLSSFKKTGRDRRTVDYIRRKVDTLDTYWKEFQANHSRVCDFGDDNHEYFQDNKYEQVFNFYSNARAHLQQCLPSGAKGDSKLLPTPSPNVPGTSSIVTNPSMKTQATDSKTTDMLKKQAANFKAFSRTVSNIDLEAITEKWEFEDLLKELQSRWSVIDTLHWQLDSELDGENEEYESTFSANEKTYNFMKRAINSKLWSTSHREKSTPKMEIPYFNGNYYQWVSFKDLFTETIHSNPLLSKAQKMQFLKSKVRGEAEKLIQHLQISSDNYQVCWDILNHRYQNTRLIFTSHVNILLNLSIMQQPNASQIKRIHDTTNECINSIKNLGVDVSTWDPLLVHILSQKIDAETHSDYMESLQQPRDLPTLKDFLAFLETKFTTMESSAIRKKQENQYKNNISSSGVTQRQQKLQQFKSFATNKNSEAFNQNTKKFIAMKFNKRCPICNEEHGIYHCQQFLSMSADMKRKTVSKHNLCKNCLFDHKGKVCISNKTCRECNAQHNTILHKAFVNDPIPSTSTNMTSTTDQTLQGRTCVSQHNNQRTTSEILITTAMVCVQASNGTFHQMRALVDQCSQVTLITEKAAQLLKLQRKGCKGFVSGVGEKENSCKGVITLSCSSRYSPDFSFSVEAYVMYKLVKNLPSSTFKKQHWPHLEGLQLADSDFNISRSVDIILGSDIYPELILDGLRKGSSPSMPVAQHTKLGWIICGSTEASTSQIHQCYVVNYINDIQRFWEVEDITEQSTMSSEDHHCIEHFKKTTIRREDGQYEVRLPFKQDYTEHLGSSKSLAMAQFRQLERKFSNNKNIEQQYKEFMHEYIQLRHMKLSTENYSTMGYYLPHHAVTRAASSTTKLRVVFNASAKSSTSYSLNDVMFKGPNLQKDLQQLILNWRQYQFVYTADIEKMYRQIRVHEDDQVYQKILWRASDKQPVKPYQLTTVTYGTKPAPFLAMMCLKQLAEDEKDSYPEAAKALQECFYMDDYCGGSHSLKQAKQLRNDLIHLLQSGGFNLRKWTSNEPSLLLGLSKEQCNQKTFEFKQLESTKTLGLGWDPQGDKFIFQCNIPTSNKIHTKRTLLSDISKLFDPLGWLTPISTTMKILFQAVWASKLEWDDELPADVQTKWFKLSQELQNINMFEIKRWLSIKENDKVELHGFSDASQKAYSAVIYCRVSRSGQSIVSLVAAKARVVPMNKEISMPRLELMGAELLSKLMYKVQQCLSQYKIEVYGWVDSTAVLGWLQGDITRWKPFIATRVKNITEVIPSTCWSYIKSIENPADCASRGLSIATLLEHELWWNGPSWLSSFTKLDQIPYTTSLEVRASAKQSNAIIKKQQDSDVEKHIINNLLNKYSSFTRITRIFAWILRLSTYKHKVHQPYLTLQELRRSKLRIIKNIQLQEFADDIDSLKKYNKLSTKSKLLNLNPSIDQDGILRVGGRLENARIGMEMRHPIIISHDSRLTSLLIQQAHELTFHGGARLTLSNLRLKYWIIGGNRATKKHIRKCLTCRKQNPILQCQLMGDLPSSRINPESAFYYTGVDYTGYVDVKANKGRGIKTTKGYIAVFVCMVTKAVHLELVSDLTSSAFLAALSRMASRRGAPRHIFSDNGTNFVGANRMLQEQFHHLQQIFNENCLSEISEMGIEWHFNAPAWPNAGGLWERAVRSLKHHLKRVVGEQKLTYEEYATLLSKLEACLNSRPLFALTEDPEDLDFLTPSHFLSARPGLTIIETEQDARTRWHLISKLFEDLWKRWKSEYLPQLSVRPKWLNTQENIKIGDLVTIQDENLPPGKWMMGRVLCLHPGQDRLVRVVSLKTKNGIIKRPVVKLSILPAYPEENSNSKEPKENAREDEKTKKHGLAKSSSIKTGFISMAISLIIFMSLLMSSEASSIISKLPKNMSLYFDSVDNLKIIRDKWTLVVYYDMNPYWEGTTAATKFLNYSEKLCSSLSNKERCGIILFQLQHEFNELRHYNRLLLNQQFDTRARQRRGLINGIGYVANSLFGVLDERFAEQYKKDIELVRKNEHHLTHLLQNQTSVIEAEYNLLKRTEQTISLQHKAINQHLNELDDAVNTIKQTVTSISEVQDFTLSAITTSNLIQNLKRIQDTLLDTITDIYHGKFNTHLLTPDQLRNELQLISSQLTKDITIPLDNMQTDLKNIYNMLNIKARILQDYFIFEITFPLTTRESYKIYKIIPVPHQIRNDMINVLPVDEYIAVNLGKDAYFTLPMNTLQVCLYHEHTYLCHISTPINYLHSEEKFCQIDTNTNQCVITKSTCKNIWVELNDPAKYFYFCCNSYSLRIICQDHVTFEQLTGAGIITLESKCTIKGKDFAIYSRSKSANTIHLNPGIATPRITELNHMVNISLSHYPDSADETINNTLINLGKQIEQLKTESADSTGNLLSTHDIHQYAISYGFLGVAVIAAAVFLWKRRRASTTVHPSQSATASVLFSHNQCAVDQQSSEVTIETDSACNSKQKDISTSPIPKKCIFVKHLP